MKKNLLNSDHKIFSPFFHTYRSTRTIFIVRIVHASASSRTQEILVALSQNDIMYGGRGRQEGDIESTFPYLKSLDESRARVKLRFGDIWRASPERDEREEARTEKKISSVEEELADDGVPFLGPSKEGTFGALRERKNRKRIEEAEGNNSESEDSDDRRGRRKKKRSKKSRDRRGGNRKSGKDRKRSDSEKSDGSVDSVGLPKIRANAPVSEAKWVVYGWKVSKEATMEEVLAAKSGVAVAVAAPLAKPKDGDESDSSDLENPGPMPDPIADEASAKLNYGHALLPGEGAAMASFVQSGQRIPRRGEVGMGAEVIDHLETVGYVMSGSRHKKMNAVRLRKENQVYTAEEARQMAIYAHEQRQQRETERINDLKEMLGKRQEEIAIEKDVFKQIKELGEVDKAGGT